MNNNVIDFGKAMSVKSGAEVIKKIDFRMLAWCQKQYENFLNKQNDLQRKKIEALLKATYEFYLDFYLTNTKNTVDFHEAFYKSGDILCDYALKRATSEVLKVINEGRIDECYVSLQEKLKRGNGKKRHYFWLKKRK